MALKSKKKSSATGEKVKVKKAKATVNYTLEARVPALVTVLEGNVSDEGDMLQIQRKRPRSPKVDIFQIPKSEVMAAAIGESGWIVTDDPEFTGFLVEEDLTDADVGDDFITGTSGDTTVFLNRAKLPTLRFRSAARAD